MSPKRPSIHPDTRDACCGAISLNVELARRFGWSEKALNRAFDQISRISKREGALSHRAGPVNGCPCVTCDVSLRDSDLPREYRAQRTRWRHRGLIEEFPR